MRANLSKVKSVFAYGYSVCTETGSVYGLKGQLLKPQKTKSGHLVVTLQAPGFGKRNEVVIAVHVLVAYQLHGVSAFADKIEIRHLNGNPTDNRGVNLLPGTRAENLKDIPLHRRKEIYRKKTLHLIGKVNCNAKLKPEQVKAIKQSFSKNAELAKQFGVSHTTISNIRTGKSYVSIC